MDAFSYLSVLLSIIIGLAVTHILQGIPCATLVARTGAAVLGRYCLRGCVNGGAGQSPSAAPKHERREFNAVPGWISEVERTASLFPINLGFDRNTGADQASLPFVEF